MKTHNGTIIFLFGALLCSIFASPLSAATPVPTQYFGSEWRQVQNCLPRTWLNETPVCYEQKKYCEMYLKGTKSLEKCGAVQTIQCSCPYCTPDYNVFEAPAQNATMVVGNSYLLKGWGCTILGPKNSSTVKFRESLNLYVCPPSVTLTPDALPPDSSGCTQIMPSPPISPVKNANAASKCGSAFSKTAGWQYSWAVPVELRGPYALWSGNVNTSSGPACIQWASRSVTMVTPTPVKYAIKGDADGNNAIQKADLDILITALQNIPQIKNPDMNKDGKHDLLDYEVWRKAYYGETVPVIPTCVPNKTKFSALCRGN